MSPRRWPAWPRAGGWSPSRARASPLTARRAAQHSRACKSAGGWCSRRRSTVAPTLATAPQRKRGSPSSIASRPRTRTGFLAATASPRTSLNCWPSSNATFPRAHRWPPPRASPPRPSLPAAPAACPAWARGSRLAFTPSKRPSRVQPRRPLSNSLTRRASERGAVSPRLVPGRRHGRRQGPAGRGRDPRQLAQGPAPGRVGVEIRQADRGRPARLGGARPGAPSDRAARPFSAGCARHPQRRRPVHHLCDPVLGGAARQGEPAAADRGLARARFRRRHRLRRDHAMANAAGDKGERGDKAPSQQGRAGLRLQHALPDARVLYVSATGATTVHAYAQRLGLWGGVDFPFATRGEFVQAIEAGGVAAMEVLARDLKALGLYAARSLSYEGVEVELVEHELTPEQTRIYDAYASAFQIIHQNLTEALKATNITGEGSATYNRNAKAAAKSAFESNKQRFFNHLITAMKAPTLIRAIETDLAAGHAAVVQIVSTGEALMERRLAEIPTAEWGDLSIDITPRELALTYLAHSFPTQLHELFSDEDGNLHARPVFDAHGQPVLSREALERRERMIEHLAAPPPLPRAPDQIVRRFRAELGAPAPGPGPPRPDRAALRCRAGGRGPRPAAPDRKTPQRGGSPPLCRGPAGLRQSRQDGCLPG